VKDVRYKARMIRAFIGLGLVVSLLVMLTGCWLLNVVPVASFTASATSGAAPLTINFSAILSFDEDGFIVTFEWDFGDGSSGTGESASHTYTGSGTFTVVLRVTDDNGATDTASKTITVTAAEEPGAGGAGPTASFTATPLTGQVPFTVQFNASATVYLGHAITSYTWDFGDGVTGTGVTPTHTYGTAGTYNVVLRIIAADNTTGVASRTVIATAVPVIPGTNNPTASFTTAPNKVVAPQRITADGGNSSAAAGRTLTEWIWRFGDGTSPQSLNNDNPIVHNYVTDRASETFTITLIVIDDASGTDTEQRTVTVENKQPVAGFEINDTLGGGGNWLADNVTFNNVQTDSANVLIRAEATVMQGTTPAPNDGTQADPLPKTAAPGNYGDANPGANTDHDLCYDPEGQGWTGADPFGFPNTAWGIEWYKVNWGDGNTQYILYAAGPGLLINHVYDNLVIGVNNFTITVTAIDYLGAETSYSRQVTINRTL